MTIQTMKKSRNLSRSGTKENQIIKVYRNKSHYISKKLHTQESDQQYASKVISLSTILLSNLIVASFIGALF